MERCSHVNFFRPSLCQIYYHHFHYETHSENDDSIFGREKDERSKRVNISPLKPTYQKKKKIHYETQLNKIN